MTNNDKVFIGIPAYSRSIDPATLDNINSAGVPVAYQYMVGSLLARNFNNLMCLAYNGREHHGFTHFCLMHADQDILTPGWLCKMLALMRDYKLDVLSAVVRIKDESGDTSCALDVTPENDDVTRLTMGDLSKLPNTFTPQDTGRVFGNNRLLINTGLMLIRMKAVDPVKCHFCINDEIKLCSDGYHAAGMPEDWNFSRMLQRSAISYGATQEIVIGHWGMKRYENF